MSIWMDLRDVPYCVRFVDAGGVRTRALQLGEGEPILLLHGTSSHLEVFSRNVRAYAQAGFAVHAIDMLGHGYTDAATRDLEVPDYVSHACAYMDAVGIDRVHLIGEALGGWVCARLAGDHPGRVHSLQLLSSGGSRAVPEVMARVRETTTAAVMGEDRALTRARLANLYLNPDDVDEELVDVRYAIYHQPAFQAALPHLLAMQSLKVRTRNMMTPEVLGRIQAPTLIFWGRHNPMGDTTEADGLASHIPNALTQIFDDCGHFLQIEKTEEFNTISTAFLRSADVVNYSNGVTA